MIRTLVLTISILISSLGWASANTPAVTSIKGFHEWKSEKVQSAVTQMSLTRGQIHRANSDNNRKSAEALEKQLDQLKWNLEVAKDLSVTDYFVLYLSQQTQVDRFTQAATKLTTKEVAELMEAYANTLSTSAPSEVVVRPAAQPSILRKLPVQATQTKDQFK